LRCSGARGRVARHRRIDRPGMEKAIQPPTVFSGGFPLDLLQKSFSSIDGTGKMPIPQELFFLVGWASCPS